MTETVCEPLPEPSCSVPVLLKVADVPIVTLPVLAASSMS